jgi:hypothetical protein
VAPATFSFAVVVVVVAAADDDAGFTGVRFAAAAVVAA